MRSINKSDVDEMRQYPARRFCFAGDKNAALRRAKDVNGYQFGVIHWPFGKGIGALFPQKLFKSTLGKDHPKAVWRPFESEEERTAAEDWCDNCGSTVFLYDCLDLSMALGFNFESEPGNYTDFGKLEHDAKQNKCPKAANEIAQKMVTVINQFDPLRDAKAICAVPKHIGKDFHLPERLAKLVAKSVAKPDITPCFTFGADKPSLKNVDVDEKWDRLATCHFEAEPPEIPVEHDKIILIDDKYQSGFTMQFVASKLLEHGASEIYGLCAVKTWSDDDNVNK